MYLYFVDFGGRFYGLESTKMATSIKRQVSNIFKLMYQCVFDPGKALIAMTGLFLVEVFLVIWVISKVKCNILFIDFSRAIIWCNSILTRLLETGVP